MLKEFQTVGRFPCLELKTNEDPNRRYFDLTHLSLRELSLIESSDTLFREAWKSIVRRLDSEDLIRICYPEGEESCPELREALVEAWEEEIESWDALLVYFKSKTHISEDSFSALMEALSRVEQRAVQRGSQEKLSLFLGNLGLNDRHIAALCEYLKSCQSLVFLDLSHNRIGLQGARDLGYFLEGHSSLKVLQMVGNSLSDKAVELIVLGLKKNTKLREIYLSEGMMTLHGYATLLSLARSNSRIEVIDVSPGKQRSPRLLGFTHRDSLNLKSL